MVDDGRAIGARIHFRDVALDVVPLGIEFLRLRGGIENAKPGLGIRAGPGAPLPAAIVGGQIGVEEFLHEVALAPLPGDEQVLGQKSGDDHADAVMHPTGGVELAHSGVDQRVAGAAFAPHGE